MYLIQKGNFLNTNQPTDTNKYIQNAQITLQSSRFSKLTNKMDQDLKPISDKKKKKDPEKKIQTYSSNFISID
ncbi:hypothetical protein HanPI659440_Chr05g0217851 [Helianthus annuus]|nr:hypothetical protein HanPI659440_Chr05g0217851 [Helianthus annuus]